MLIGLRILELSKLMSERKLCNLSDAQKLPRIHFQNDPTLQQLGEDTFQLAANESIRWTTPK